MYCIVLSCGLCEVEFDLEHVVRLPTRACAFQMQPCCGVATCVSVAYHQVWFLKEDKLDPRTFGTYVELRQIDGQMACMSCPSCGGYQSCRVGHHVSSEGRTDNNRVRLLALYLAHVHRSKPFIE